ncbi:MAG: vWA domain-containing protein [Bacillota bacterium]
MRFFSPAALGFAAAVLPIILLYVLKLRRKEVRLSSTLLWRQLVRDFQANAPWQRLRRNLLLYLQILIVAFLTLALARPYILTARSGAGDTIVIMDLSASMAADDVTPTRLARAQGAVEQLIARMGPKDTMSIIGMGPLPRVLIAGSRDRRALGAALADGAAVNGSADLGKALSLADSMARGKSDVRVLLIGDGGYADLGPDFPLTLPVTYVPIGGAAENVALAGLSARSVGSHTVAMVRVINHGHQPAQVDLTLKVDGSLHAARQVALAAGEEKDVFWEDIPPSARTLQAHVTAGGALKADDDAFAVIAQDGAAKVLLVTKGNLFLERALTLYPGVDLYKVTPEEYRAQDYDLYVFDGFVPPALPKGNIISFDPPVGAWPAQVGATVNAGPVRPAKASEQLLSYVDLNQVHVAKAKQLTVPTWGRAVIEADAGPLLVAGEDGGRRTAVFAFDLHQSDLPLRTAFPILVQNLLAWELPARGGVVAEETGGRLRVTALPQAETVEVTDPGGRTTRVAPPFPPNFLESPGPGIYRVTQEWQQKQAESYVAVNFPAATESALDVPEHLTVGSKELRGQATSPVESREVWPVAAAVALGVLSLEWWVYHRGS